MMYEARRNSTKLRVEGWVTKGYYVCTKLQQLALVRLIFQNVSSTKRGEKTSDLHGTGVKFRVIHMHTHTHTHAHTHTHTHMTIHHGQ